jgi:ATP-binding cassette subfamily F protein 3
MQGANFLMLDEPTNHLDIPSQEVLQEVLVSFQGTILLVTHDRYLIRTLASRIWAIAAEQLWVLEEGYDAYREWHRERRSTADEEGKADVRRAWEAERAAKRAVERERVRHVRERNEIEGAIHRLEARLEVVEVELAAASTAQDVERVTELGLEHGRLQAELDAQWVRWENLA